VSTKISIRQSASFTLAANSENRYALYWIVLALDLSCSLRTMFSVLLSFGSNLGDRHKTLTDAWHVLNQTEQIQTVRLSPFYETLPVGGPAEQPMYINAAGIIQTVMPPLELLQKLQQIESDFGRIRTERWGARTLDIDILLYENRIVELPTLTIPHVAMLHRRFVLEPAHDIAADWIHPLTQQTLHDHWKTAG
jgi:2-amino-4-hydroxy-6-hydroxymethyldihydropteridine diphosphokinase